MPNYSNYRVPREADMGRVVRLEQRRAVNRTVLFVIGGVVILCVCILIGAGAVVLAAQSPNFGQLGLPLISNATPTAANKGPTPVPYGKSATNDVGLRLTVTGYQRPLPFQEINVPEGQELALVTVRLDNIRKTGGNIKCGPADFKLVTPEGDSFSADNGTITTGSILKAGELAPGKSASGDLVFFIYSDVKDLFLNWSTSDGGSRLFRLSR